MRPTPRGDVVSPDDLLAQIRGRYADLVQATTWGARALRYNPGDALGHGIDFVTVEEDGEAGEPAGAYRVGFRVAPERYAALFGAAPAGRLRVAAAPVASPAADTVAPHPLYAYLSWAAVVNPSPATLRGLWPLLDEGYALARRAWGRRPRPEPPRS